MLGESDMIDLTLVERYGDLLPDSLIRSAVDAAPAAHVAQADVAAPAEAVRTLWTSAADVLDEIAEDRARAIFPTRRNLERLARFGSLDEARADAAGHPVRKVVPWIEERGGSRWLCIPDDLGYPITAEPLETAKRF